MRNDCFLSETKFSNGTFYCLSRFTAALLNTHVVACGSLEREGALNTTLISFCFIYLISST